MPKTRRYLSFVEAVEREKARAIRGPGDVNGLESDAKTENPRKNAAGFVRAPTKVGRHNQAYFSSKEAAVYLRISHRTLTNRSQSGDTPSISRIGRIIRYSQIDLDRFLALTRVQSTSDDGGRK
jgi:hypothetical protein